MKALKFSDRIPYQRMIKGEVLELDLFQERQKAIAQLGMPLKEYMSTSEQLWRFQYPVQERPTKVKSIKVATLTESFQAPLLGIQGQYLFFPEGKVMNVRSNSGHHIKLTLID